MRKKKLHIEQLSHLIDELNIYKDHEKIKSKKGKWFSLFNSDDPILLEIGMGEGAFLNQLISTNEAKELSRNYIGMEIKEDRVFKAYQKNLKFIESGVLKLLIANASKLSDFFGKHEIAEIYLNFSDPWPKKRHIKHRLTAPSFLTQYNSVLAKNGLLYIKTDNKELYQYSLENLREAGWKIKASSTDLRKTRHSHKNLVTEFEQKFIRAGKKIYYIKCSPN
jgi:tRNA (guanine-N7-)-methyltransferase